MTPRLLLALFVAVSGQGAWALELPAYRPDGKVEVSKYGGQKYEVGTVDGFHYEVFPDLSAVFRPQDKEGADDAWSVRCEKDAMTDRKRCFLNKENLWAGVNAKGVYTVWVGGEKFPRAPTYIRIDGGKPFVGNLGSDGDFSAATIAQVARLLPRAKQVVTRYTAWPEEVYVDKTIDPRGFSQAVDYAKWAVGKL